MNRTKYTGLYGSWYAMKPRCGNPKNLAYHNYGGRGITYPKAWESFSGFSKDMAKGYIKGLTLDRIDNNKSYSKTNCRWATRKTQCNNMRKNILISYKDDKKTLRDWADTLKLSYVVIRSRYYRGMTIDQIFQQDLYRPRTLNP